jgi:hypothetical protein
MFFNRGKLILKNFQIFNQNNLKLVNKVSVRYFGSGQGHNTHGNDHAQAEQVSHGNKDPSHTHDGHDGHDDHGHHHHEISGEVDFNKTYVHVDSQMQKLVSLTGLNSTENAAKPYVIHGYCKARKEITPIGIPLITRSRVYFNDLADVSLEDNNYFHPEPYGYLISDDVNIFIKNLAF